MTKKQFPEDLSDASLQILKEHHSHTLNYKAIVQKYQDKTLFEVYLYIWRNAEETDISDQPVWEKIAGPYTFESFSLADEFAIDQLRTFSGERTDDKKSNEELQYIKMLTQDETAEFLDPQGFTTRIVNPAIDENGDKICEECTATSIIVALDIYLVEIDEKWYIGTLDDTEDDIIDCFRPFESLPELVEAIQIDEDDDF